MTKKDYILIAASIKAQRGFSTQPKCLTEEILDGLAHRLAAVLASYNPRFDSARFLEACGV